jgi:hypothetical protein
MRHMPVTIPSSTCDSITWRLMLHAGQNWPQLDKVQITCRGGFAYVADVLPGGEQIPLCRGRSSQERILDPGYLYEISWISNGLRR